MVFQIILEWYLNSGEERVQPKTTLPLLWPPTYITMIRQCLSPQTKQAVKTKVILSICNVSPDIDIAIAIAAAIAT